MIRLWSSSLHCDLIISCFIKIQNALPFWCRLTQIVLEKRPLNGHRCSSSTLSLTMLLYSLCLFLPELTKYKQITVLQVLAIHYRPHNNNKIIFKNSKANFASLIRYVLLSTSYTFTTRNPSNLKQNSFTTFNTWSALMVICNTKINWSIKATLSLQSGVKKNKKPS